MCTSQCGNLRILLPLQVYVKSILKILGVQKLPFLLFQRFWILFFGIFQPSKFAKNDQTSEPQKCQDGNFCNFWNPKNWFHVKYESVKNSEISTLWFVKATNTKMLRLNHFDEWQQKQKLSFWFFATLKSENCHFGQFRLQEYLKIQFFVTKIQFRIDSVGDLYFFFFWSTKSNF